MAAAAAAAAAAAIEVVTVTSATVLGILLEGDDPANDDNTDDSIPYLLDFLGFVILEEVGEDEE